MTKYVYAVPYVIDKKKEQQIEKALKNGHFARVSDFEKSKKLFAEAVKNYRILQRSKPITIRVNQEDLIKVKVKAEKNKIPYKTLLNVLIHQYAEGLAQIEL